MDKTSIQSRLLAGALIGGAIYFDPLAGYVPMSQVVEGAVAGFVGGELVAKTVYNVSSGNGGMAMGYTYAICGALGGFLSLYTGSYGPLVAAASVIMDTTVGPYLTKIV